MPEPVPEQMLQRLLEHIYEIANDGLTLEEALSTNSKTNYRRRDDSSHPA